MSRSKSTEASGAEHPEFDVVELCLTVASRAPSLHNSQPWQWELGNGLDLRADPRRHLEASDPSGRQMIVSCGAVLHHARVAFGALGWQADVHRLPDRHDAARLASLSFRSIEDLRARDVMLAAAAARRRTDRRPFLRPDPSDAALDRLRRAAAEQDAEVVTARGPRVYTEIFDNLRLSGQLLRDDPRYQAEVLGWIARGDEGIPYSCLPADPMEVPIAREFPIGYLDVPDPQLDQATLLVLRTRDDSRLSWLHAGEALSAVLLEATAMGFATCVLTHAIDVPEARRNLDLAVRSLGWAPGWPHAVIRVGRPPGLLHAPATPRRTVSDTVVRLTRSA